MKVAVWDIETWDLGPEFGPLLCASVLSSPSGKMISFRQDRYVKKGLAKDMADDKQLCIDLRDFLEEHHITVGYFSKGFDIAHLRSRLVLQGERPLKEQLHIDPIWFYKGWRGIRPRSSKMKHVTQFLQFEEKPEVSADTWLHARLGDKTAMDEVVDRCESDVRITAAITDKTVEMGFVKNISRY